MKKNISRGKHTPDYPTDPRKVLSNPKSTRNKTLVEEKPQNKISKHMCADPKLNTVGLSQMAQNDPKQLNEFNFNKTTTVA